MLECEELHGATWPLVTAYQADMEGDLLEEYGRALPAGRASNSLPHIARAVAQGRVGVLLHEAGRTIWGRVDHVTGEIVVHDEQRQRDTEDADIIDDLCEMTLLKRGEVFEVSSADLLRGSPVGAIYRY